MNGGTVCGTVCVKEEGPCFDTIADAILADVAALAFIGNVAAFELCLAAAFVLLICHL